MEYIKKISLEKCKYYFDYTDEGKLIWKHVSENAVNKNKYYVGGIAGSFDKGRKYYVVRFEKVLYSQHRVLYQLYHNVELTNEYIDHIDGDTTNNKKDNLRVCTSSQNRHNRTYRKDNKLKIKNVHEKIVRTNKYWCISIKKDGKRYSKYFRQNNFTLEEVIKIRNIMLKELHGEFHNLG